MEQLAVLTSTRDRPQDKLIFAALERRGIPFVHADERHVVIDFSHRPGLPFTFAEISYAMDFNGLFNGAETEIADGIADYVGDVLRQ
jgi:hypothetical protein